MSRGAITSEIARLEAAIESLERDVCQIRGRIGSMRSEVRASYSKLLVVLVAGVLGLAVLIAKEFV